MSQGGFMNMAAFRWALEQPIKPQPKMVLATLAWNADEEGVCRQRQAQIAEQVGIGVRMVKKHIRLLIEKGYAQAVFRGRGGNIYMLPFKGNSSSPFIEKWGTVVPLKTPKRGILVPLKAVNGELECPLKDGKRGTGVPVKQPPLSPPSDVSPNNPFITPPLTPQDTASNDAEDLREAERKKTPAPAWIKRLSLPAWQKLTPVHIAELETQANRLGLDIKDESLACDDWMKGQRRTVKAPYTTLKNWLSKAARMREFDGARSRYSRNSTGRVNPPGPGELTIAANQ